VKGRILSDPPEMGKGRRNVSMSITTSEEGKNSRAAGGKKKLTVILWRGKTLLKSGREEETPLHKRGRKESLIHLRERGKKGGDTLILEKASVPPEEGNAYLNKSRKWGEGNRDILLLS